MKKLIWIGWIFFLILSSLDASAEQTVLIRMPNKATVVGPQLRLGEVADVIGENKAVLEKVRRLILGKAALAGTSLKLTQGYVKIVLRREGYSLTDFTFEGAEVTEVNTQSQEFPVSDLLPELKAFVLKGLGEAPENVEVKMAGGEKGILLPAGKVHPKFRAPLSGKYEGTLLLTAELEVDGHLARVLPLRAVVEVFQPVVVTTKRVEKGGKFTLENVALVRKPTSALLSGAIGQLENVVGRTAAVPAVPGTVLKMNELYDPPMIKRGQMVQAVVRRGNVEITVQAKALEDGKAGDKIRVENSDTHKLLHAKVLDEKTVLVEQAGP